ncbi:MAG: PKD domain-containing protein [Candidatus Woesearchaeota archaeon]
MARLKILYGFALILLLFLVSVAEGEVRAYYVKETDLVRINPQVVDPDNDKLTYYFSYPLNEQGEWQTNYGDAGEYYINITASDGQSQTNQRILLIVEKKNRAPQIIDRKVLAKETQVIDLKTLVKDDDGDPLSYVFSPPFDKSGLWKTTYGDEGYFVTNFWVSDGEAQVRSRVEVQVLSTNPGPVILSVFSENRTFDVYENTTLEVWVNATASEKSSLNYEWKLNNVTLSNEDWWRYHFNFSSEGEQVLELKLSDGEKSVSKKWLINVIDVKRAPEFEVTDLIVKEGDLVSFEDLPTQDQDGHKVKYLVLGAPFDEQSIWQTNYSSAGIYNLTFVGSNGDKETVKEAKLTVLDVDQETLLEVPSLVYINEGEELRLKINAVDPDGDKLNVTIDNLPEGAVYNENKTELSWIPSYDTIQRTSTFMHNLLNALRLEKYFLQTKSYPVTVSACNKEECVSSDILLKVSNVNRAPLFTSLNNITITETELAQAKVEAVDPDGDIVRYYYTSPLGRRNGKWSTSYGDKGDYPVYVTATDGSIATTKPMLLKVLKNDRAPTLSMPNDDLAVNEGQQFMFRLTAKDADKDNLTIRLENVPPGASFKDGIFLWTPGYDLVQDKIDNWWNNLIDGDNYFNKKFKGEKEVLWLNFIASDGEIETAHPVKVTIKNVNRVPFTLDYMPVEETTIKVGMPITFHVTAKDWDRDNLTYSWEFSGWREKDITGTDTIERTFTSTGEKEVKVVVSDGRDEMRRSWKVNVVDEDEVVPEQPGVVTVPDEPFTIRVYVIDGNKSQLVG